MQQFLLKREKTLHGKAVNIIAGFAFMLIWVTAVKYFYSWLYEPVLFQIQFYERPQTIMFFNACLLAPITEELVFRHLPIQIVKHTELDKLYLPVILAISIIFGILHGGIQNILIQGVMGVVLSVVYIKNDFSYKSSTVLHMMWNFVVWLNLYNLN